MDDREIARKAALESLNQLREVSGEPPLTEFPQPPFCSFCGRAKNQVGALVEGLNAHICRDCASAAHQMLLRG